MDYRVRVWHSASGEWVASADGMPGCTVKGKSREGVLDEIKKAIDMYVQGLLEEAIDQPEEEGQAEIVTVSV